MDSIQIDTGEKRIAIIRDGENVGEIVFNPNHELFAERFYKLFQNLDAQIETFDQRKREVIGDAKLDENGIPENAWEKFPELAKINNDIWEFVFQEIDSLFGDGTCKMVFGDIRNIEILYQLLDGIGKYFSPARKEKLTQYLPPKPRFKEKTKTKPRKRK